MTATSNNACGNDKAVTVTCLSCLLEDACLPSYAHVIQDRRYLSTSFWASGDGRRGVSLSRTTPHEDKRAMADVGWKSRTICISQHVAVITKENGGSMTSDVAGVSNATYLACGPLTPRSDLGPLMGQLRHAQIGTVTNTATASFSKWHVGPIASALCPMGYWWSALRGSQQVFRKVAAPWRTEPYPMAW